MTSIYMQTSCPQDWQRFLAEARHWKKGYSAAALAHCWQEADGFPAEIKHLLTSFNDPEFASSELLLAIPEHKVPLPGGAACSQSDVWALARTESSLISIAVEGKVAEPFGDKSLGEWLIDASDGKLQRLEFIKKIIGREHMPDTIRYQLLHRLASAVIEAKRFHARHAMMIVHSFSSMNLWFEDYAALANLFDVTPEPNKLYCINRESSPRL